MRNQVVILSEKLDSSTCDVMDWIDFLGGAVMRIDDSSKLNLDEIIISNHGQVGVKLRSESGDILDTTIIDSLWYRRGGVVFNVELKNISSLDKKIKSEIIRQLQAELNSLRRTVHNLLALKNSIGNPNHFSVDKLSVLIAAKKIGIEIPDTLISNNDSSILNFGKLYSSIITKSITDNFTFCSENDLEGNVFCSMYTEEVHEGDLSTGKYRFPSCVQEKIDKEFDIRVFYLKGICYGMAIFSQLDFQTSVDFRKYNLKNKNRVAPYRLPEELTGQINLLMNTLELDSGSIDLVLTKDGRHVFLEVNPVGQFGMVSYPCNYHLEKKIAEQLLK